MNNAVAFPAIHMSLPKPLLAYVFPTSGETATGAASECVETNEPYKKRQRCELTTVVEETETEAALDAALSPQEENTRIAILSSMEQYTKEMQDFMQANSALTAEQNVLRMFCASLSPHNTDSPPQFTTEYLLDEIDKQLKAMESETVDLCNRLRLSISELVHSSGFSNSVPLPQQCAKKLQVPIWRLTEIPFFRDTLSHIKSSLTLGKEDVISPSSPAWKFINQNSQSPS